jgi:hypothetical protein
MSGPETRGPDSAEGTLAKLLESMSADAPSPSAKQRTLAALGFGTAAAVATGTASAVGATGLVKLATIGALAGFAMGGVAVGVQYAFAPAPPARSEFAVAGPPSASAAWEQSMSGGRPVSEPIASTGEEVAKPAPLASTEPPDLRAAERRTEVSGQPSVDGTTGHPPPAVEAFEAAPSASSLREETRELDRARAAIVAGDPGAGLVALDGYAAAFPRGALVKEAVLLRIKALVMSGDRPRARALARSFTASHPRDPHAEELRSLLEP